MSKDDEQKAHKEKIEKAAEDLAEKTSEHAPGSNEALEAKENRAKAEKGLVDSRDPEDERK